MYNFVTRCSILIAFTSKCSIFRLPDIGVKISNLKSFDKWLISLDRVTIYNDLWRNRQHCVRKLDLSPNILINFEWWWPLSAVFFSSSRFEDRNRSKEKLHTGIKISISHEGYYVHFQNKSSIALVLDFSRDLFCEQWERGGERGGSAGAIIYFSLAA